MNSSWRGFSELTQQSSPDTGTTTFAYDSVGNLASQIDARSKTTTYGYDLLNRLTGITYPAATALNTVYSYDTAASDCQAGETFKAIRCTKSACLSTHYAHLSMSHRVRPGAPIG